VGNIEDRIEHFRAAIDEQQDQRDWLASVKWGEKRAGVAQPGKKILAEHDRIIAMYEQLIVDAEVSTA
jgi:hypothetical protein